MRAARLVARGAVWTSLVSMAKVELCLQGAPV